MAFMSIMLLALSPYISANLLVSTTILIAALIAIYFYYQHQFKYFQRQGLKNPKPKLIVGNILETIGPKRLLNERKWVQEYGKFYGIFQGARPRYVVADAELITKICIKDFDVFPNHEASELLNKIQRLTLFFAQDEHWKRLRALQSATFTSGKIKRMYKLLQKCAIDMADNFGEHLEQQGGKQATVQLKDIFSLYTIDGIASCGYGLKMERERANEVASKSDSKTSTSVNHATTRNEFAPLALDLFKFRPWRILARVAFPVKLLKWFGFYQTPTSVYEAMASRVRAIIEGRRRSGKSFDDYLQLLLDAKLDDKMELSELDDQENHHAGLSGRSLLADQAALVGDIKNGNHKNSNKARLSDEDILASALFLLIVGVETTATLLTHCVYALSHHADIQEKLYEELLAIRRPNCEDLQTMFEYEKLTSCAYLDSVISETLRSMSPVLQLDRVAKRDYYVDKYNVTIPKDGRVLLAFHAIMNDPDYWPEPQKFQPDRFMPANRDQIVPGSYCPFGLGPRHCLGMRFSLTEAKLGLAMLMMKYKFEPAPGTNFPPLAKRGIGLHTIATPVAIVKARN